MRRRVVDNRLVSSGMELGLGFLLLEWPALGIPVAVRMPVVDVGKVRVSVAQGLVRMNMAMRLPSVPGEIVFMLVVFVMNVRVLVGERLVLLLVPMVLGQMQPYPDAH